jgi:hypothetical protein
MTHDNKNTVLKHHTFYWNTSLSQERMDEIDALLDSLTHEQRRMIDDLLLDHREEVEFDCADD